MIAPFAPEPARSDHPNNETDYNNDPFQYVTSYKRMKSQYTTYCIKASINETSLL